MNEISFGDAIIADIPSIQETARASWYETYKDIFTGQFIGEFLARAYSTENLRRSLQNHESDFLVARDNEQVIAFCHFGPTSREIAPAEIELYRIYVHPNYWRIGIGGRLLEMMEARLIAQNIEQYFCYVHSDNAIGKNFYLRRHFEHLSAYDRDNEYCLIKHLP